MQILIAIALLGGLGLIFGLVLAAASKVFYVETDPRLDALNECLPGANCGGCGYAGCGAYAEAVLNGAAGGLGFTIAIVLFASVRERVNKADCPECFKGYPLALIAAGLLALAFMGFSGLSIS